MPARRTRLNGPQQRGHACCSSLSGCLQAKTKGVVAIAAEQPGETSVGVVSIPEYELIVGGIDVRKQWALGVCRQTACRCCDER